MPVDQRFFTFKGSQSLRTLLGICGIDYDGEADPQIESIAAAGQARAGELCFAEGDAAQAANVNPDASACFVTEKNASGLPDTVVPVVVTHPRFAHKLAGEALYELKPWSEPGDAPSIHETATVAPNATIGTGAAIGEGAVIAPGAVIGPGVQIGARTKIGPNATIRCALIGNDVTIQSGERIREPG